MTFPTAEDMGRMSREILARRSFVASAGLSASPRQLLVSRSVPMAPATRRPERRSIVTCRDGAQGLRRVGVGYVKSKATNELCQGGEIVQCGATHRSRAAQWPKTSDADNCPQIAHQEI